MLPSDSLVLVEICSRLTNATLAAISSVNHNLNTIFHTRELWVHKLQTECSITPQDYFEDPQQLYQRLVLLPRTDEQADQALDDEDLIAVKYLASLDPPILPTFDAVVDTASFGDIDTITFLASLNLHIPYSMDDPDEYINILEIGATEAAIHGRVDDLKYFAALNPPVYPTQHGVNLATSMGRLNVIKYLAKLSPSRLPDQDHVNMVAFQHPAISEYLASLDPPLRPN
jgi:hypothetical protein